MCWFFIYLLTFPFKIQREEAFLFSLLYHYSLKKHVITIEANADHQKKTGQVKEDILLLFHCNSYLLPCIFIK